MITRWSAAHVSCRPRESHAASCFPTASVRGRIFEKPNICKSDRRLETTAAPSAAVTGRAQARLHCVNNCLYCFLVVRFSNDTEMRRLYGREPIDRMRAPAARIHAQCSFVVSDGAAGARMPHESMRLRASDGVSRYCT